MMNKLHLLPSACLVACIGTLIPQAASGTFSDTPFGSSPFQRLTQTPQLPVCGIQGNAAAALFSSRTHQSCSNTFGAAEEKQKEYGFTKATYRENFSFCPNTYSSAILEAASNAIQNYQTSIYSELLVWNQTLSHGIPYLSYVADGLSLMAYEAADQFLGFFSQQHLYSLTSKAVEKTFIRTLTSHTFAFMSGANPRSGKSIVLAACSFEVMKDLVYRVSYVLTENIFFKELLDEVIPSSATVNNILDDSLFNLWELPDDSLFQSFKTSNMKSSYAAWRDGSIHKQGYFSDWIRFSYKVGLKYQRSSELYDRYMKNLGTEASQKTGWEIAEFLFGMLIKYASKGKII